MPLSFHILTSKSGRLGRATSAGRRINGFLSIIRGIPGHHGHASLLGRCSSATPRLKVVCVEADAGWVPHYMYRMDHAYKRHRHWLPAGASQQAPERVLPREHLRDLPGRLGGLPDEGLCNVRRIMWANDFPHSRLHLAVVPGRSRGAHEALVSAREGLGRCTTTSASCTGSRHRRHEREPRRTRERSRAEGPGEASDRRRARVHAGQLSESRSDHRGGACGGAGRSSRGRRRGSRRSAPRIRYDGLGAQPGKAGAGARARWRRCWRNTRAPWRRSRRSTSACCIRRRSASARAP